MITRELKHKTFIFLIMSFLLSLLARLLKKRDSISTAIVSKNPLSIQKVP